MADSFEERVRKTLHHLIIYPGCPSDDSSPDPHPVEGKSILSNVEQYKIHDRYMGTLATDLANHPWRNDRPLFDAIVTGMCLYKRGGGG